MKFKMLIILLVCVVSCAHVPPEMRPTTPPGQSYREAVRDASVIEKDEVAHDLIPIKGDNEQLVWDSGKNRVLVVTWKSNDSYEKFLRSHTRTSQNEAHVIWVTTVPQVRRFCRDFTLYNPEATEEETELRLKQYLGLNESWQYDVFIEMWVNPKDLFRPCVDPEINDSECNLEFGTETPVVKGIKDYPAFYKNLYFSDFRTSPGVPWTGLGYTYDWGNPLSKVGASEFILIPGAAYEIRRVFPTMDYGKAVE